MNIGGDGVQTCGKIILKMYRAREIGAAEGPELYATTGRLAHKAHRKGHQEVRGFPGIDHN